LAAVDELTRRYYEDHGRSVDEQNAAIASPVARYFPLAFLPGARILDLGAGIGRDLATLLAAGYDAIGIEPSGTLRTLAAGRYPTVAGRLMDGALPGALPPLATLGGPFAGVLCSAVLQHVPRSELFAAGFAIKALLEERGRLLISLPSARDDVTDGRDAAGRLFNEVTPDELELLLERMGFQAIGRWTSRDAMERGHTWTTLLLELRAAGAARPIDHIEAVLSTRERKVATYKLALLRALCEIAQTAPRSVTFAADGVVQVPIRAIAERWILYYWPLFTAPTFLPQMNGERQETGHRLAFTGELNRLIAAYQPIGGLSVYATDRRSGRLPDAVRQLHAALIRKLEHTVRVGPVTYAGGSLPARLFGYTKGQVLVAVPLWRELSLLGHWIEEALLLRWAELVVQLAAGDATTGDSITRLVLRPSVERETSAARTVYLQQPTLTCVWTGRALTGPYLAVDHVLPYALWRNNDLWNLLPVHAQVNQRKADLLPTTRLLEACRPAILGCWQLTRQAYPRRFAGEARAQLGNESQDLGALFSALVEAVEITALQRAVPRWEP
jgi:SAM-dependent methyltransferase